MKNSIPVKYLLLADILLAAGMSAYWFITGLSPIATAAVFIAIFFAGCPLPYVLAGIFPIYHAAKLAAKQEIQLKSSKALHELQYIDTLVLNKNGTITEGHPYISDIVPEGMSQSSLLALAASAERDSVHPIGKTLYNAAISRRLRLQRISACNEIPGYGVEAIVNGKTVRVGRLKWLKEEDIDISAELLTKNDQLAYHGKMPVFVSNGKYARGIIALEDAIPKNITAAIHLLQKFGLRVVMLTGDSQRTASAIQKATDIDDARADLSPMEKAREIQLMRARGASIAMAGSLGTDQLAFAEADLAIKLIPQKDTEPPRNRVEVIDPEEDDETQKEDAPPPPSETALQPDIVLQGGLHALIPAIKLARSARNIIHQNRMISYLAWLLLLPPAMGLLTVFGGPFLNPDIAFGGFLVASILTLLNTFRIQ
ncbi:MAG: cation-translocating P-type ATPase [Selenomonadaceae bacterium]|nr:cation-translocating P-type ATPase [Selenomonadaceae bacterium]